MAESWQIACSCKTSSYDAYERIERLGGPDGEGWTLHRDEIVTEIKKGTSFWVDVDGDRVDVIIVTHSGREFIKTRSDGDSPNNLLNLPECVE
jgi:hypothetical protein